MAGGADRKLVLLRHAKSAWPDVPDDERPLGRRGRRDAPAVGGRLRSAGHVPDQVLCSTARRARQTWELAETELRSAARVSFEDRVYQASSAGLLDLIRQAPTGTRTLLLVGHDPAIPELALALAGSAAGRGEGGPARPELPGALDRMRVKFPTGAVAVLEFTGIWPELSPGSAWLTEFVTPRDIPRQQPSGY